MNLDFLKDKKILIAGGAGLLGTSLTQYLISNGVLTRSTYFSRPPPKHLDEHYQQYDLEPEYEFPVWAFRSGWTKTHDIIQCAWSRCYLIQEKAYATL